MYIPKHFKEIDKKKLVEFMQEYNFAAIVNSTMKRYWASHLPFLISVQNDDVILKAHMAKANPQWVNFGKEEVLVIFQEPHAYISPKLYDHKVSVPTWNYIAVHAYGIPEILSSTEQKIGLLEELFRTFEADFKNHWDTLPSDYKNDLLNGIVAFQIKVTNLEGKYKLSQNRSETERERIIDSLEKSNEKTKTDIAKEIKINRL